MLGKPAAIAANRFGLGARPGDSERIGGDPAGWLTAELEAPLPQGASVGAPPESALVLQEIRDSRLIRAVAAEARRRAGSGTPPGPPQDTDSADAPAIDAAAIRDFGRFVRERYVSAVAERHRRAVATDRPFVERLTHFWSNHFAVSADKQPLGALAGLYEREAIAPHVTGNFADLLLAAERHPAMILYLDNQASIGPGSDAARFVRRRRGVELGLNENLAREILELHTLGVDGGYTQADVTELAKALTGWSIGGEVGAARLGPVARRFAPDPGEPGEFHFRAALHEPGAKVILGMRYREQGIEEAELALKALALHPATARHLALKLARHFVADEPPPRLIERLAKRYLDHDGELVPVYRTLLESRESWQEPLAKYKTPQDLLISCHRALGRDPGDLGRTAAILTELGQRPFTPGSPAGWPDTAAHWDGGDALLKRIEWAAALGRRIGDAVDAAELAAAVLGATQSEHTRLALRGAESGAQALGLLFAAPEFQRR